MPAAPDYAPSLAASGRRRPPQRATFKNSRLGFFGAPSGRTLAKRRSACRTASGYRRCGYKTASGRPEWLSRDPMGTMGGINLYGYVGNNPITFVDPYGLWSFSISAYDGLGGGFAISGSGFHIGAITLEGGVGIGGGISFDPWGDQPNSKAPSDSNSLGVAVGAGLGVGPIEAGYGLNAGITEDCHAKITGYAGHDPEFSAGKSLGSGGLNLLKLRGGFELEGEARAAVQITHTF